MNTEISKRLKTELEADLQEGLEESFKSFDLNLSEAESAKEIGKIISFLSKKSMKNLVEKYNNNPKNLKITISGEDYLKVLLTSLSQSDVLDLKEIPPNFFDSLQDFPKKLILEFNISFLEENTIVGEHKFSPAKDLCKIKEFLSLVVKDLAVKKIEKEDPSFNLEENKEIAMSVLDSIVNLLDVRFHQGKGETIKVLENSSFLKELLGNSKTSILEIDGKTFNNSEEIINQIDLFHEEANNEYNNPINKIISKLKFR